MLAELLTVCVGGVIRCLAKGIAAGRLVDLVLWVLVLSLIGLACVSWMSVLVLGVILLLLVPVR